MRHVRYFCVAVLATAMLPFAAAAADDSKVGIWDSWFPPDAVLTLGAEHGFFEPNIETVSITNTGAHVAALGNAEIVATSSIERIFSCQEGSDVDLGCTLVMPLTRGTNYVLVAAPGVSLETVGGVGGVMRDIAVAVSRCSQDPTNPTATNMASALILSYIKERNAALEAAGEEPVHMFCGDRDAYRDAVADGVEEDAGENVIYAVPLGASPKRYAALPAVSTDASGAAVADPTGGRVDAAILAAPFHLRALSDGHHVLIDSNETAASRSGANAFFSVPLPEAGIIMLESVYNTPRGQDFVRNLCRGINHTIAWMTENPETSKAELSALLDPNGDFSPEAAQEMWLRTTQNANTQCVLPEDVIAKMGELVGGPGTPVSHDFTAAASVLNSN